MLRIMDVPCSNDIQIEKISVTESENPALEISPVLQVDSIWADKHTLSAPTGSVSLLLFEAPQICLVWRWHHGRVSSKEMRGRKAAAS